MNGARRFVGLSKKGLLPTRQRGNISLLMLGMAFVFIACAVLALDTGRLYLERQRLQTQADMAALELQAKARFDSSVTCDRDDIAFQAAVLNGFSGRTENVFLDSGDNTGCSVTLTTVVPDSLVANLALLWPGSGFSGELTLSATAYAQLGGPQWVTFSGSGSLLDLDTNRSLLFEALLGEMLGSAVDLNVLSQSGLASASISLLDLAYGLGLDLTAASIDQLLSMQITASQLIQAALATGGDELGGRSRDALQHLASLAGGGGAPLATTRFRLSDILDIDADIKELPLASESRVSIGTLLDAAIYMANGSRALELDNLTVDLSPLANLGLTVTIGDPPQLKVGPAGCLYSGNPPCVGGWRTESTSAQLALQLNAEVDLLLLNVVDVKVAVESTRVRLGIADLTPVGDGEYDVLVEGQLAPLAVQTTLELLGLTLVGNDGGSSIGRYAESSTVRWSGQDVSVDLHTGLDGALSVALSESLGNINLPVLGVLLNPLLRSLMNLLSGLAAPIATVLDGLLMELGISVGVVTVYIYDVSPGIPTLVDPTAQGQ